MHFRWWNSFNLLAVILLAVGIIGAISGPKMVFDPGRASSGKEWIIYLVAGGLMLVNGFLPPSNASAGATGAGGNAAPSRDPNAENSTGDKSSAE